MQAAKAIRSPSMTVGSSSKAIGLLLTPGKREDAGGKSNPIAFDDDPTVMDGVVRKEDRLQHLGRGFAINREAGFDSLLQPDGLFDRDEGADADFGQTLNGLDDDFNILALLMGGGKKRQIAQLGQHPAQLGLENDEHSQNEERGEPP